MSVTDSLVFCNTHSDEPIKFYCSTCEAAICNTCQVIDHRLHDIVTVDQALETVVPQVQEEIQSVEQRSSEIEGNIWELDLGLEEVKDHFRECRGHVDEVIEARIEEMREQQETLREQLQEEEQAQVAIIEEKKSALINRRKVLTNLRNVARASLDKACNASVLTELVDGRIGQKLREARSESRQTDRVSVRRPRLEVNKSQWDKLEKGGLVGKVVYNVDTVLMVDRDRVSTESGDWSMTYIEVFRKAVKETLKLELKDLSFNVTVCDDKIWVPVYSNKEVQVYTLEGELVKSIRTEGHPASIEKATNGQILVCSNSGLYVVTTGMDSTDTIARGNYTDLAVCGEAVYTWDYNKQCIVQFLKEDTGWRQVHEIRVGWIQGAHPWDTLLVRKCGKDKSELQWYIGLWSQHTVYQVDSRGNKVRQFGGGQGVERLQYPHLCGVNSIGELLVADRNHYKYKVVDTESGHWTTVFTAKNLVYDAKITGQNTLWLARYTGSKFVITRHEVV